MLDKLIGVLAPHDCVVCGDEGALLCAWCRLDAVPPLPDRCYRCFAVSQDSLVCAKCRRESPLRHVWVRAQYEAIAKELVYRLKFGRTRAAAQTISLLLDDSVPALQKNTIVTFVPTATSRVRQRGYDQAQLIANSFAKQRGLRYIPLLARQGQSRQVGADRKHRQQQAAGNYRALNLTEVKGAEILLIDDIITTGATIESATKVLKKAGAKQVNAAIFAQKQ